ELFWKTRGGNSVFTWWRWKKKKICFSVPHSRTCGISRQYMTDRGLQAILLGLIYSPIRRLCGCLDVR
ncbi:hypothetical protein MHYP_G00324800, partial [Metynnis hypsauchen]